MSSKSDKEVNSSRKQRLIGGALAVSGLIGLAIWILYPNDSALEKYRGPRLQSDSQAGSTERSSEVSFQLPNAAEAIDMASLQEEMVSEVKRLQQAYPKDPAVLELGASVYYDLNKLDQAEKLWRDCISQQPKQPEFFVSFAQFLIGQERPDEVIELITSAHSRSIETAGTYHQLATAYERTGALEEAAKLTEEITVRFPKFGESWLLLGKILTQQGKFKEAEESLLKAIELDQPQLDVWPLLVTVYARQGKREQATELQNSMRQLQQSSKNTSNEGEQQPFQVKFEESLRQRAARMFFLASVIEKRAWNNYEAQRLMLRSIQLQPNNPTGITYLAEQFIESNRIRDAIVAYQRLIEIEPDKTAHFSSLAGLAFRERNVPLAVRTLEAGLVAHPETIELQIPLAKMYMSLEKPIEARRVVTQVLQKQQNVEAMMILGASYQATGDKEEAEKILMQAQQLAASVKQSKG